ncbi:ABC transporter substrate-binding protein [Embleya sp. NPDC020886]|uniref:ABC transporter substrate-binding protein n=1 Tax=Embleya sp. NPDC020886 TaxID=3363980 RepID=UPI003794DF58
MRAPKSAVVALVCLCLTALLLGGCSAGSDNSGKAGEKPAGAAGSDGGGFPRTMHNVWGDVTIHKKPKRVVALGYADVAVAAALDANIVGAVQSYGSVAKVGSERNLPYGKRLSESVTWLNPMDIGAERIARLEPDLILANAAFTLNEPTYKLLNAVAPVVTYEQGLYRTPWVDEARRIARALGADAAAEQLIDDSRQAITDLRARRPKLEGRTYLYGQARAGVAVMVVDDDNLTARFMSELGLVPLPSVAGLGGKGSVPGTVDVSLEHAGLFEDAGVLFMTYQSPELQQRFENDPIVARLAIMKTRYVPLDIEAATALQAPNAAAVPWLLDRLRDGLNRIPV